MMQHVQVDIFSKSIESEYFRARKTLWAFLNDINNLGTHFLSG